MVYSNSQVSIATTSNSKKKKGLPAIPNLPTPGAAAPRQAYMPNMPTPGAALPPGVNIPSYINATPVLPNMPTPSAAMPGASSIGGSNTDRSAGPSATGQQQAGVSSQTGWLPETGFAKAQGYAPDFLDTIINQHPEILTGDVLKSLGMANTSYAGQLADESGMGQLVTWLLAQQNGTPTDNNAVVNDLAGFYKNRVTPGGSLVDTKALINEVLNAQPGSAIYNELGLGASSGAGSSSNGQVNANSDAVNQMLQGILGLDQSRYTQQATRNALAQEQTNYINAMAKGQTKAADYLQYMRGHPIVGSAFS